MSELTTFTDELLQYEGSDPIEPGSFVLFKRGLHGRFRVVAIDGKRAFVVEDPPDEEV